jgi:hypothetical protein
VIMRLIYTGLAAILLSACPGSSGTPSGEVIDEEDTEAGTSVDTEADTEANTEVDTEADTEADTDDGSFACGELTCSADEFCNVGYGGAQPPPGETNISYACSAIPTDCLSDLTCDCLFAEGACYQGAGDCQESSGHLECSVYYP